MFFKTKQNKATTKGNEETRTRGMGRASGISLGVQKGAAVMPLPLVTQMKGQAPICRPQFCPQRSRLVGRGTEARLGWQGQSPSPSMGGGRCPQ